MPFRCPECLAESLEIGLSMQLPPDSRSDEIVLQVVSCERCGFGGLAVYEESRRGALGAEAWNHTGYWVSEEAMAEIASLIKRCPEPDKTACQCPAHLELSRRDDHDRWREPGSMETADTFALRLTDGERYERTSDL